VNLSRRREILRASFEFLLERDKEKGPPVGGGPSELIFFALVALVALVAVRG
jgi:hypothetical protein